MVKAYRQLAVACGELARIELRVRIPGAGVFDRAPSRQERGTIGTCLQNRGQCMYAAVRTLCQGSVFCYQMILVEKKGFVSSGWRICQHVLYGPSVFRCDLGASKS